MKSLDQEKDYGKEVKLYIMRITQKSCGKQKAYLSGATRCNTTIILNGTLKSIIKQKITKTVYDMTRLYKYLPYHLREEN